MPAGCRVAPVVDFLTPFSAGAGSETRACIGKWVTCYNAERLHSALGGQTPEAHAGDRGLELAAGRR